MYYELYIDVFFLENFMMDIFLLLLTGRLVRLHAGIGRVFLGAFAGAFLTCVILAVPDLMPWLKKILFHVFVNFVMLKICFQPEEKREILLSWLFLYFGGFLMGGVLYVLRPFARSLSLFLFLAVAAYLLVSRMWDLAVRLCGRGEYKCLVKVAKGEKTLHLKGMLDSGNRLTDPGTGKPVHIIGRKAARALAGEEAFAGGRVVVFHSVGKERGVMPLLELDQMEICTGAGRRRRVITIRRPVVAVCEQESVTDLCDIILNVNI